MKSDNGSLRSAQGPVEQKERQSSRNVCTFKGKTYTHTKRNRKDKAEETCTFKGKHLRHLQSDKIKKGEHLR